MRIDYDDLTSEKLKELLTEHQSFEVTGLSGRFSSPTSHYSSINCFTKLRDTVSPKPVIAGTSVQSTPP